jgi:monothiol glutaredoxin
MKGTPAAPKCGFSSYVVTALDFYGVQSYFSVNTLDSHEVRDAVKKYSAWPTIPQLFIDSEFVGGCDIIKEMHNKGELKDFLAKRQCLPPA